MSWVGKLFGTDEAVREVLNTGKELLDDAFYTDAEKASDRRESADATRAVLIEWFKNTQGQNLSRRVIALSSVGTWLLGVIIATVLSISGIWVDAAVAPRLDLTVGILDSRNEEMGSIVLLVLTYYFAAPKVGEVAEVVMSRFGNKSGKPP